MLQPIEVLTADECRSDLKETFSLLEKMLSNHSSDMNFLRGVSKFCDRVKKYPISRLSSSFHSLGVPSSTSVKITATSILKKARKGKIYVQPGAFARRKSESGSKNAIVKGMTLKKNAFGNVKVCKKRPHKFSINVEKNEPPAKKAGRHMASKTRFFIHTSKQAKNVSKEENRF